MNNKERNELRKIVDEMVSGTISANLLDLQEKVQEFADNEQDKIDGFPENLQYSERAERMREYVDALENICSDIDSLLSEVDEVANAINDVADDNI